MVLVEALAAGLPVVAAHSGAIPEVLDDHGHLFAPGDWPALARILARRFLGDPASADWRHYGRLAGFTNRKEKYRRANGLYPFVLLHEASGRTYRQASKFLSEVKKMFEEKKKRQMLSNHGVRVGSTDSSLKSIEDFRRRSVYCGDHTRSDLAYAIYALAHGVPESIVRDQLASRDLNHKGNQKRQQEYLDRTVLKARSRLSESHP